MIGGGVAGTFAAAALADRGIDVVRLDDGDPSASAACLGHGLPGVVEAPHRTAGSLGETRMAELLGLVRASREVLGEHAIPGLAWRSERPEAELDADVATLRRHGLSAERVAGGWTCADAFSVHPREVLAAWGARSRRVSARALEVRTERNKLRVLTTHEPWSCELVVFACGWRAPAVERWFEERVVPVREQALGLAATERGAVRTGQGWTAWSSGEISGCRWASPHLEVGETAPVPTEAVQRRLREAAEREGIEVLGPARAWIEAHTCDGLPFVGPLPGDVRRLALVGFCGNDWGLAPGAADQLARGLIDGTAPAGVCAPGRMF
ncbi:MAG: FAD-binding oxidoreductase [Myxococcales bacterium]|nr:FAD-binding oxidoreductase [Myxococcales bacterium]